MSGATERAPKPTEDAIATAVELTAEGLQWMLLRTSVSGTPLYLPRLYEVAARGVTGDVWLNAYDAAPEAVRHALTHSVTSSGAGSVWTPAILAAVTGAVAAADLRDCELDTPVHAFAATVCAAAGVPDHASAVARFVRTLQRCGLFAAADRRTMQRALKRVAYGSLSAFELLIADPNADAALHGPTRCSAGDARNPPRHHSGRSADEHETLHDVLRAAASDPAVWRVFSDARLPFAARAMDEEWAFERTGPCGCAGVQRIAYHPLHHTFLCRSDEAGEWLAARLPPKRLNERTGSGFTPLMFALSSGAPLPRTVAALLSRVPDVDLTLRAQAHDRDGLYTAAELLGRGSPQWLPLPLAAELKLKTQQFGAQYLPSAAVLCVQSLQSHESVGSAARLPRELVRLVLQYTALPQPNPWPNAHAAATTSAPAGAAESAPSQRPSEPARASVSGRKRRRDACAAATAVADTGAGTSVPAAGAGAARRTAAAPVAGASGTDSALSAQRRSAGKRSRQKRT